MAQQVRVYLDYPGPTGVKSFLGRMARINAEPGWPGTHYVDFDLAPFFENCTPVLRKGIREEIEKKAEFVAASIETPVDSAEVSSCKRRSAIYEDEVGVTFDTSQWPFVATIWAPAILLAMERLQKLTPPQKGCCCKA